jgi:hypothetical protein
LFAGPPRRASGLTSARRRGRSRSTVDSSQREEFETNEDQVKGKAKKAEGKGQETWGDIKERAGDAWDEARTPETT